MGLQLVKEQLHLMMERSYVGEFKDGVRHGQGTYTSQDGTKGKGKFKDNTPWNISLYGKYGNFTGKYVNGVKQ